MSTTQASNPHKSVRDPRLDVWRGIAMLIIMVAHIPMNHWGNFIPARYGPSDAAEMFVFCSGYAAAIAFGGTFERHGWWMGTRRILFRCWQIYWAHLALFFVIALICVWSTDFVHARLGDEATNYVRKLNLTKFFTETEMALAGLFTLTWVPNYFDILPMYFVILVMVPIVVGLRQLHPIAPFVFCIGLYVATWIFDLELPAEPWSERAWFFNPLAWQLLFFTGFAISRGWLKTPAFDWRLIIAGIVFVILMVPISRWQIYTQVDPFVWLGVNIDLKAIHDWIWLKHWDQGGIFKTNEHPLRYLHILTLSYLAVCLVKGREHLLQRFPVTILEKVGQQALAAFLWSMAFAWFLGVIMDNIDPLLFWAFGVQWDYARLTLPVLAGVNLTGVISVVVVCYIAAWYKSQPWRQKRPMVNPPEAQSAPA